jgi:hypothetical protein
MKTLADLGKALRAYNDRTRDNASLHYAARIVLHDAKGVPQPRIDRVRGNYIVVAQQTDASGLRFLRVLCGGTPAEIIPQMEAAVGPLQEEQTLAKQLIIVHGAPRGY